MKCNHCGTELNQDDKFCVNCGNKVKAPATSQANADATVTTASPSVAAQSTAAQPANMPPNGAPNIIIPTEPPKKNNKKLIAIIAGVLAAIVLIVGGFFGYKYFFGNSRVIEPGYYGYVYILLNGELIATSKISESNLKNSGYTVKVSTDKDHKYVNKLEFYYNGNKSVSSYNSPIMIGNVQFDNLTEIDITKKDKKMIYSFKYEGLDIENMPTRMPYKNIVYTINDKGLVSSAVITEFVLHSQPYNATFSYDKEKRLVKTTLKKKNETEQITYSYDKKNKKLLLPTYISYESDAGQVQTKFVKGYKLTYDKENRIISVTNVDANLKPIDNSGSIPEVFYLNRGANYVKGFAKYTYVDNTLNIETASYFMVDGKPTTPSSRIDVHMFKYSYSDDSSTVLYYDADNKLTQSDKAFAAYNVGLTTHYNKRGEIDTITFIDKDKKPVMSATKGYATVKNLYSQKNIWYGYSYFDTDNQPINIVDKGKVYHKYTFRNDTGMRYFDTKDNIVTSSTHGLYIESIKDFYGRWKRNDMPNYELEITPNVIKIYDGSSSEWGILYTITKANMNIYSGNGTIKGFDRTYYETFNAIIKNHDSLTLGTVEYTRIK